jgi:hypothetical protein
MKLTSLFCLPALALLAAPARADTPPPAPSVLLEPPPTKLRSVPAVVSGSVLAAAGTGLALWGTWIALFMPRGCDGTGNCHSNGGFAAGISLGGVVGIAGGVALIVWGAWRVPDRAAAWVGAPGGAGWQWRF